MAARATGGCACGAVRLEARLPAEARIFVASAHPRLRAAAAAGVVALVRADDSPPPPSPEPKPPPPPVPHPPEPSPPPPEGTAATATSRCAREGTHLACMAFRMTIV